MVKFNGNRSYFQRAWNERGNYDRRSYFVLVNFCLECTRTDLSMKVDTGASRTVIGLDSIRAATKIKNTIMQEQLCKGRLESATGGDISYREIVVEDFYLTPDVVFPKIKLAFSEDIGSKALLGMDILSLFSFMYNRKEGELCLMDCDTVNRYIERHCFNKELGYVDPSLIAGIDGVSGGTTKLMDIF